MIIRLDVDTLNRVSVRNDIREIVELDNSIKLKIVPANDYESVQVILKNGSIVQRYPTIKNEDETYTLKIPPHTRGILFIQLAFIYNEEVSYSKILEFTVTGNLSIEDTKLKE